MPLPADTSDREASKAGVEVKLAFNQFPGSLFQAKIASALSLKDGSRFALESAHLAERTSSV
jgi:hypothetical protein